MKQKITALFLTLAMLLSLSATVWAEEGTTEGAAEEASATAIAVTVDGEEFASCDLEDMTTVTGTYVSLDKAEVRAETELTGVPVAAILAVLETADREGEITGYEFIASDDNIASMGPDFLTAAYLNDLQPIIVIQEDGSFMLVVPQRTEDEANKDQWVANLVSINVLTAAAKPVAEVKPAETPAFESCVVSNQALTVNGEEQSCTVYNIDGYNYFMLRDIAFMLKDTSAKFSIGYDNETRLITIVSGEDYTADGSEMQTGEDKSATCAASNQAALFNNEASTAYAYNIGGNNFFQLRGLGEALGFDVDYDAETRTMIVTTTETGDADSTEEPAPAEGENVPAEGGDTTPAA